MIKIGFDVFGGDNSPIAPIMAAKKFAQENSDTEIILFGKAEIIKQHLDSSISNIRVIDASEKIEGNDDPTMAIRKKKNSSIVLGAKSLKSDEVDCFLSAGNTGALVAAGVFIVRRLKGIDRPALPGFLPSNNKDTPTLLLDLGANVDAKSEHLIQYAKLATIYLQTVTDIKSPSISLLNIGEEENKGTDLYKETYQKLSESELNFTGNMEAREILTSKTDIILMDGFVGNMVLKTLEGAISFFNKSLKEVFLANFKTKMGALLVKGKLKQVSKQMDYKEIGATPILGLDKLMLKAHGSSDEKAFYSALVSAKKMVEANLMESIKKGVDNE